jgi:hypothetical protein
VTCLDAETLAAWMDGGLTGAALEDVRAHVADCERCQALMGAMGATRAAIPATEPQRASASALRAAADKPRRWLMWGVPLAAATTAIAIWVAIPEQRQPPAAPAPAAAPAAPLEKQERATTEPPPAVAPQSSSAKSAPAQAPPAQRSDDIAQLTPDAVITESVPPPLAPPSAPQRPGGVAGQIAPAPRAEARVLDAAASCGPPPPAGTAGQLTASSAATPDVCWAVGRGGLVLLSIDGRTWQRVNFPEMTDLASVRATDARTASISTADGRTFSTANRGQTWTVR